MLFLKKLLDFKKIKDKSNMDYWKKIEKLDKTKAVKCLGKMLAKDPAANTMIKWLNKNDKELFNTYMKGLKDNIIYAKTLSYKDFGMYVYIAFVLDINNTEIIEMEPKSIKLQKELELLYTEENINNAIDNLIGNDNKEGND